jgi:hypothetical protein
LTDCSITEWSSGGDTAVGKQLTHLVKATVFVIPHTPELIAGLRVTTQR